MCTFVLFAAQKEVLLSASMQYFQIPAPRSVLSGSHVGCDVLSYSLSALETLGGEPRSLSEPPEHLWRKVPTDGGRGVRWSESSRASVPVHECERLGCTITPRTRPACVLAARDQLSISSPVSRRQTRLAVDAMCRRWISAPVRPPLGRLTSSGHVPAVRTSRYYLYLGCGGAGPVAGGPRGVL